MKKIETWLPIFTGFYESIFSEGDRYVEYETELGESEYKEYYENLYKAGVTKDFFDANFHSYVDYKKGYEGAAEYICEGVEKLDSAGIIKSITYQSVQSPKYYNFSTDSINCEIEYDDKKLMVYLLENKEALKEYIERRYTSCDGFISSYSNDLEYWLNQENHGEHQVGSLLQFVFETELDNPALDLYYEADAGEGFTNSVEFDQERMIADYKESLRNEVV